MNKYFLFVSKVDLSFPKIVLWNLLRADVRFPITAFGNDKKEGMSFPCVLNGNLIKVKALLLFCLLCCFAFAGLCCKDEPTKPTPDITFTLAVEDITCTEAYLRLTMGTDIISREVTFGRDSITLFTRTIGDIETIVMDTNLVPGHTYTYTAQLINQLSNSCSTQARTMDTTSHDFSWTVETLGDSTGSSVLYDVAIINDTLAYACGEIYSGGLKYNLARWNGRAWEFIQIQFYTFCGQAYTDTYPAKAIIAFSDSEIFISDGAQFTSWNGQQQGAITCLPVSVNKMWGRDKYFVYTAGSLGQIGFFNGTSWTKLESGTDVDLKDVYGTTDGKEVWACGWKSNTGESILLKKQDSQWQTLWHSTQSTQHLYNSELLGSLWIGENRQYFITGSGDVFRHSILDVGIIRRESVNLINYAYRIRGNGLNDVMLAGDAAMIWHFNGATWKRYGNLMNQDDRLYSLAISPTIVVAVGRTYRAFPTSALVIKGNR